MDAHRHGGCKTSPYTSACGAKTSTLKHAALVPEARGLTQRYDFLAELGRGGMGIVYLARDRRSGQSVAIKLLAASLTGNTEATLRFAREARTVAALDHPHIVRTLAIEELSGRSIAIVSEYILGKTLRELLHETGAFPFDRAVPILRDLASALAHAHSFRIVHRDVKPENIVVEESTGAALLADFGIARSLDSDSQLTMAGSSLGTPSYMAPELVKGGNVDVTADVYSLGLVGWEMLTGSRPWEGETLYEVLHKQQHEELPSLAGLRPDIPAYLLSAIEGAIAKNPRDRWANGGELFARLTPTPGALPARRNSDDAWTEANTLRTEIASTTAPSEPLNFDFARNVPTSNDPPQPAAGERFVPEAQRDDTDAASRDVRSRDVRQEVAPPVAARRRKIGVGGPLAALVATIVIAMLMLNGPGKGLIGADPTIAFPSDVRDTTKGNVATREPSTRDSASGRLPTLPPAIVRKAPAPGARTNTPARTAPPNATRPGAAPPRTAPAKASDTAVTAATGAAASGSDVSCGASANDAQRACLIAAIDRNDAALTRTYQALIARMRREAGGVREPPAVQRLRAEQRAWIDQRDRACRATSATNGERWGAERIPCFARMSDDREAVLRRRLDDRPARD